jgi:predicted Zn-dependent peptidase
VGALYSCASARALRAGSEGVRELPPVSFGGYVFHRRQLANGLRAMSARDEGEGVSVFVIIAAGKREETPRTTGLAHLAEHAMYTGTAKTGPGEHDRRIREMAGSSNAFTRDDYTLFYDHAFPADRLDEVLAMEADRLRNLSFDPNALYEERERLRVEEAKTWRPSQRLTEDLEAAVFRRHPYAAGVLDEDGRTLASVLGIWDVREFYDRHYHPNAAAVVVAGDVDPERALEAVQRAFGPLPAGPPREPPPEEPDVVEPRSLSLPSSLPQDRVEWVWLVPAMGDPDRPALHVLARLLSRRNTESGAALFASMGERVDKELFRLAVVGPDAENDLNRILGDLLAGRIEARELEEVKRLEVRAHEDRPLRTRPYFSLAASFGVYEALGHTEVLLGYASAVEQLTLDDVLRVARVRLDPRRRIEVRFEGTGGELEPLPEDLRALQRAADEATQAGDLDRAVAAYTKLLSLEISEMSRVIALASRGQVRLQQREYGDAVRDFERALELVDYPKLRDLLDEARALEAGALVEPGAEPEATEIEPPGAAH